MNKFFVVFALFFVLSFASAQTTEGSVTTSQGTFSRSLNLVSQTVDPSELNAGDQVSIVLTIENEASGFRTENIEGTLKLTDEFTAIDTQDSITSLRKEEASTLVFKFKVNAGTAPGTYALPIELNYLSNGVPVLDILKATLTITANPELDVTNLIVSPLRVDTGSSFQISAVVKNIGDSVAKEVFATLTLPEAFKDDLIPLGETSKRLGDIQSNDQVQITYTFQVDREADVGVVAFTLKAQESTGASDTETVSVRVVGHPELVPSNVSFDKDVIRVGDDFSASIELENIGGEQAKAVYIAISAPAGIIAQETSYIGSVDKDDTGTAVIDFTVSPGTATGPQTIGMTIFYRDNEEMKSIETTFSVNIRQAPPQDFTGVIVVVIVLAGVGYFYYRRKQQEKSLKKV